MDIEEMKKVKLTKKEPTIKELEKIFDNNLDLLLFYLAWIKNGLKAGKAYKELHPDVDEHSADTLGSRLLKKVEVSMVMQAYGLNHELYWQQLKDGVQATKFNDFTGEREADHRVRKDYHDKLGRLLGIETETPSVLQQFNMGDQKIVILDGSEKNYEELRKQNENS